MVRLKSTLLWGVVGFFEIPITLNLLIGAELPWGVAMTTHVVAAVLAFATPSHKSDQQGERYWDRPWALWLALWVFCMPGIGWVFGAVMVLGSRWGDVQVHMDDSTEIVPAEALPDVETPHEVMARVAGELDFLPLVEIMAGNDVDLKRSAVEQLARLRTPDAISILLQYRRDPSLEVRFYVNTALTRIKKEFDETLNAARRQMQLDSYKISARVFLAKVYLQYAQSGLLDHDLVQVYEDEAVFHLTFVIESEHPVPEAFRMLVASFMLRSEWDKALSVVEKSREKDIGYDAEMQERYVEILYRMRRYADVPAAMTVMQSKNAQPHEWQTAALWWGAA